MLNLHLGARPLSTPSAVAGAGELRARLATSGSLHWLHTNIAATLLSVYKCGRLFSSCAF